MPVLRQSLVRFCFLNTTRLLRTSSTPWARGIRPRNAESEGRELPQDFAEPVRDGFAERQQPKAFDMGKYTDAVRGDLSAREERKQFIKQKPVWMKNQRSDGQNVQQRGNSEESEIRWPRGPRDSLEKDDTPKSFKKIHKKIYRPRTDEEDEAYEERSLEADNGPPNRSGKTVTKQTRYEEEDSEDLPSNNKSRFSKSNVMDFPKGPKRYDRRSINEDGTADEEDTFAARQAKKDIADRKLARNRIIRAESEQNSDRQISPKKRKDAFINDIRNARFNDFNNEESGNDGTHISGDRQQRFERGTAVADRFSQDQRKTYSPTKSFSGLTILKGDDRVFKSAILTVKNRKERMQNRTILLEGVRLINDALDSGIQLQKVFTCSPELLYKLHKEALKLSDPELLQVTQKQMTLWSDMTTPPGVIAIAKMPDASHFDKSETIPLTVVLDNIRDPGNMGAIVRVLAGAGCFQIIATKNCTDPWDSKVLRTGSGGHFHVPIHYNVPWDMVPNHLEDSAMVLLAENVEKSPVDSVDNDSSSDSERKARYAQDLSSALYHQVEMSDGSVVLIIGGETHGISLNAYALASERKGIRLVIPMGNNMDSLNAASAVAVIAFEMKRQRLANACISPELAENE